jgi:hypothetical protein
VSDGRRFSRLADSTKLSPELVDRLLGFLDLGLEVSGVELLLAFGADELRVGLKFPERLRELAAGKIDGHTVQLPGHAGESITSN